MARHGRYVMVGHPQHIIARNQTTLTPLIKNDVLLFRAAQAGEGGVLMRSLSVTQAEHNAALSFMNTYAESNQYNLYNSSCVTAALGSFNAAGVAGFNTNMTGALPHSVYKAFELGIQVPSP